MLRIVQIRTYNIVSFIAKHPQTPKTWSNIVLPAIQTCAFSTDQTNPNYEKTKNFVSSRSHFQHSPRMLTTQKKTALLLKENNSNIIVINTSNGVSFQQLRERSTDAMKAMASEDEKLEAGENPRPNFNLTFDDVRTVFKTKSKLELIRGLSILWICSFNFVANHSLKLMTTSQKLMGRRASNWMLRRAIYDQFVGGETQGEISQAVEALGRSHVGPLLAAPMEDDINSFRPNAEEKCDKNLEMILDGMRMAREMDGQYPMTQLRITALMPADLCALISERCPKPSATPEVVEAVTSALRGHHLDIDQVFGTGIPDVMKHHLTKGIERMSKVCQKATGERVIVMVDGEYTYVNPALNLMSLAMMCVCNNNPLLHPPVIFYTYQNYLKATREILLRDMEFADSRDMGFGAKLVRGAYMYTERQRAATSGYPDPIQDTFDDTSRAYDAAVTSVLEKIAVKPRQYRLLVASHNEASVLKAVKGIQQLGIDPGCGSVFFGQVFGMADHISCSLGMNGFLARKSVPYGPLDDTLAYLSRRAQENRDVFQDRRDRRLLKSELLRRLRMTRAT